jgi:hypothetical protein
MKQPFYSWRECLENREVKVDEYKYNTLKKEKQKEKKFSTNRLIERK